MIDARVQGANLSSDQKDSVLKGGSPEVVTRRWCGREDGVTRCGNCNASSNGTGPNRL